MICSYKDTSCYLWDFSYLSWMLSALIRLVEEASNWWFTPLSWEKPLNEIENSDSKSESRAIAHALCISLWMRSKVWVSFQLPRCTASRRWRTKAPSFFGGFHPTTLVAISFGFSSSTLSAPSVLSVYCLQPQCKWKILYIVFRCSMKREGQCLRKAPLY